MALLRSYEGSPRPHSYPVRLSNEELEWLKEAAWRRRMKQSELVRLLIKAEFDKQIKP